MAYRLSTLFGVLLVCGCFDSHSSATRDASVRDVGVTDASALDSTADDVSTCRGPIDWRIDLPLAAFTRASPTVDGWRIFGKAEPPSDTATSWLAGPDGAVSTRSALIDAPWAAGTSEVFAGDREGTIHVGRTTESGEAVWTGEHRHGQRVRTLHVVEDGRAMYVVGTLVSDEDQDTLVARFGETGELEWVQVFDDGSTDPATSREWAFGAFLDSRGRLIVANNIYLGGEIDDATPLWLFALSSDGEIVWEYFEDGYDSASSWGLVHDDSGVFLIGTFAHAGSSGGLKTIRLNAEDELLWTTIVDDETDRRHIVRAALPTPDGGYLLAGRINDAEGGGLAGGGQIWKLSATGELLWTATHRDFESSIANIVPFEDGFLLNSFKHMNERSWWVFVAIDQNGEVLWRHDEEVRRNNAPLMHMVPNERGEVLAVGYSTEDDVRGATAIQFGPRCR